MQVDQAQGTKVLLPYQEEAAQWLSRRKRALLVAPAGSGKTVIAARALALVLAQKERSRLVSVGWMANTTEQVKQGEAALQEFPIVAGKCRCVVKCSSAGVDWSKVDVMVVDECHHAPADGWSAQVQACQGARWGLTATPHTGDAQRHRELLELFGNAVYEVPREAVSARLCAVRVVMLPDTDAGIADAMDAKIEQLTTVRMRQLGLSEQQAHIMVSWQVVGKMGIELNAARNSAAVRCAKAHLHGRVLVLANKVKHAVALAKAVGKLAAACHGSVAKALRARRLAEFTAGGLRCLAATSLADEGLDLPAADTLVLVSGGRSRHKTEQRAGRVARVFEGKEGAVLYDFLDRCHPLMEKHSLARQALYRKLGYQVVEGEAP